jgi:hypothetical protein
MNAERLAAIPPHMQRALDELQTMIQAQHPTATFAITCAEDDPDSVHLQTTVDVEDPETVLDLVIERVLELQVDEHLPIHVIPIRPLERVAETMRSRLPRSTAPDRAILNP